MHVPGDRAAALALGPDRLAHRPVRVVREVIDRMASAPGTKKKYRPEPGT